LNFREKNNVDCKDFLGNMMVLRKKAQEANGSENVIGEYFSLQVRNTV
jgi:hypothetical protein